MMMIHGMKKIKIIFPIGIELSYAYDAQGSLTVKHSTFQMDEGIHTIVVMPVCPGNRKYRNRKIL